MNVEPRASADMHGIRAATPADAPRIAALVEQYWRFEGIDGFERERVEALLHRALADERLARGWVAELEAELCGYVLAVLVFSLEHGGLMAEIDEFFVLPRARSVGLGSALLDAAERALREAGCVRIQLQLGTENAAGRAFYRRHGYGERSGYELLDKSLTAG